MAPVRLQSSGAGSCEPSADNHYWQWFETTAFGRKLPLVTGSYRPEAAVQ